MSSGFTIVAEDGPQIAIQAKDGPSITVAAAATQRAIVGQEIAPSALVVAVEQSPGLLVATDAEPISWEYYEGQIDDLPVRVSENVSAYTLNGVTRWRAWSFPYDPANDVFYSDAELTQPIVARG